MQATSFSTFAATPARRTGLIVAAMLAAIALAAVLLDRGQDSGAAVAAAVLPTSAAMVPVGSVGESSRDPSVPSAASVFRDHSASPEEPSVTF